MKRTLAFTTLALAFGSHYALAETSDPLPPHPEPTPEDICDDAITAKHDALLAGGVNLGAPLDAVRFDSAGTYCFKVYQYGRIYSTVLDGGSIEPAVFAPILAEYASVSYESGFDRPYQDRQSLGGDAYRQQFGAGYIYTHPTYGAHALYNFAAGPWHANGGRTGRFGWPTTDRTFMPGSVGSYYWFQAGYAAQTSDFGGWLDFTGPTNEGRATGSVTLYQDVGFAGATFARSFANETPVALSAQLGTFNNLTSSLKVSMPARAELFLFDNSPLGGRSVSITGANVGTVNVSNIGAFMNDRTSAMLFVNHGTASVRRTAAELASTIETALDDAVSSGDLVDELFSGTGASGSLSWTSPVTVQFVPGERLIRVTRRANLDIDAWCPVYGDISVPCNADGEVEFVVNFRPALAGEFGIRVGMQIGTATSLSCGGAAWPPDPFGIACGKRDEILADLFSGPTGARLAVEDLFNDKLADMFSKLPDLADRCAGISVKRVHVLPGFVEVVIADNTTASSCAVEKVALACSLMPDDCEELSTARPAAAVTNSDGTATTQGVTVTPIVLSNPTK